MTKIDTAIVLGSYAVISLIIFGVAWYVQGFYSHTLLVIPLLVFGAAAAVWMKVNEESDRHNTGHK
jgi:hypothetical protein